MGQKGRYYYLIGDITCIVIGIGLHNNNDTININDVINSNHLFTKFLDIDFRQSPFLIILSE